MKLERIDPDFSEGLVSFMVQVMLTVVRFPRVPLALVPWSQKGERIFKSGTRIEAIAPLYFQFKKSVGYADLSGASILKERETLGLSNKPKVMYFELQNKTSMQKDVQHNVLYGIRQKLVEHEVGDATYVAPLFLSRSAYLLAIHLSSQFNWLPGNMHVNLFSQGLESIITDSGDIQFESLPLLREHTSIPPHKVVTTHNHAYSYLESGKEIGFHSETTINDVQNLGQFIDRFLQFEHGEPKAKLMDVEKSGTLLDRLIENSFNMSVNESYQLPVMDRWMDFGERLKNVYDIEQYMLIKFAD